MAVYVSGTGCMGRFHACSAEVPFGEVHLAIAEAVWVWFSDDVLNENERIDPLKLAPISRLGFRSFLTTVPEGIYSLARINAEEYAALDSNS